MAPYIVVGYFKSGEFICDRLYSESDVYRANVHRVRRQKNDESNSWGVYRVAFGQDAEHHTTRLSLIAEAVN